MKDELKAQVNDYKIYLKVERGMRESTIKTYAAFLQTFLVRQSKLVPSHEDVKDYRRNMIERDLNHTIEYFIFSTTTIRV